MKLKYLKYNPHTSFSKAGGVVFILKTTTTTTTNQKIKLLNAAHGFVLESKIFLEIWDGHFRNLREGGTQGILIAYI